MANGYKKTHRVATVGFGFSKSQLACASEGLESVANANSRCLLRIKGCIGVEWVDA
jgi:hypothetical protein